MGLSHALPAADAAWLHMDRPENLMVINSVMWFDEPLPVDALRARLRDRLVDRFPRFRQRIRETPTGPVLEDDPHSDIDLHVHHLALPAPHDKRALQAAVQDLMVRPLDRARPLWEAYVFDGYRSGAAAYTRMHHCIADGIVLARVLLSLTDLEDVSVQVAEPKRREEGGLLDGVTKPLSGLVNAGRAAARVAVDQGLETLARLAR